VGAPFHFEFDTADTTDSNFPDLVFSKPASTAKCRFYYDVVGLVTGTRENVKWENTVGSISGSGSDTTDREITSSYFTLTELVDITFEEDGTSSISIQASDPLESADYPGFFAVSYDFGYLSKFQYVEDTATLTVDATAVTGRSGGGTGYHNTVTKVVAVSASSTVNLYVSWGSSTSPSASATIETSVGSSDTNIHILEIDFDSNSRIDNIIFRSVGYVVLPPSHASSYSVSGSTIHTINGMVVGAS
jgi:hypothetical protein